MQENLQRRGEEEEGEVAGEEHGQGDMLEVGSVSMESGTR